MQNPDIILPLHKKHFFPKVASSDIFDLMLPCRSGVETVELLFNSNDNYGKDTICAMAEMYKMYMRKIANPNGQISMHINYGTPIFDSCVDHFQWLAARYAPLQGNPVLLDFCEKLGVAQTSLWSSVTFDKFSRTLINYFEEMEAWYGRNPT